MKADKLVHVGRLRAEFEFLLVNDANQPGWTDHELATVLNRFDRAIANTIHHRDHTPPAPPADAGRPPAPAQAT